MTDERSIPQESERRQATIMFADLSGFTAMSEKMDPEAVTAVMNECFSMMEACIMQHGGQIDKFIGDCVMAVFGVPRAIEDAPHKAVNTAIQLRNRLNQFSEEKRLEYPLDLHIGINTGIVLAGTIGGREKREYTVMGDTVNLASRLEDASERGQIFVGETTYQLTQDDFEYKSLSPLRLQGKDQRVPAYELLTVREQIHHRRYGHGRMIQSQMVGRDQELNRLHLHLLKVINGDGSIVNVIGEAGIGKSRLLVEWRQKVEMEQVTLLEGRGLSIGTNLSFHPFVDLLKSWSGIKEDETGAVAFEKLRINIRAVAPDDEGEILPFVATLMGMELTGRHAERVKGIEGEALEKLILKNFRDLLSIASQQQPLVIVIEDLHWIDTSSLELLFACFRLAAQHRILFVNVFRPGYEDTGERLLTTVHDRYPDHGTDISLQSLDEVQSEKLVRNLLHIRGLPTRIREQIVSRSEGNPFFIEEVIRSFIDQGIIEVRDGRFEISAQIDTAVVPHSIHDLLMERIDRLDEQTRTLVRNAAVIGRSFYYRILSELADNVNDMDERLAFLESVQLIREGHRKEELEYLFKHALAQEAAYDSILLERRRELHRSVAQTIEKVFSERLHEFYGMLAMHYSKAEDMEKAEEYMLKAGEEAMRSSASSEALTYYQEALRIYLAGHAEASSSERIETLEMGIAMAYHQKGYLADALLHYDRVQKLRKTALSPKRLSAIVGAVYHVAMISANLYLPELGRRKESGRDVQADFDLSYRLAGALAYVDNRRFLLEVLASTCRNLRYDLSEIEEGYRQWMTLSAVFAMGGSFFGMSRRCLDRAKIGIGALGPRVQISWVLGDVMLKHCSGAWRQIANLDIDLVQEAIRYGAIWEAGMYIYWSALVLVDQGEFGVVADEIEMIDEIAERYGIEHLKGSSHWLCAEVAIRQVRLTEALGHIEAGLTITARIGASMSTIHWLGLKSIYQMVSRDRQGAEQSLLQARTLRGRESLVAPFYLAPCMVGQLLVDLDELEEARTAGNAAAVRQTGSNARRHGRAALSNARKYAYWRTATLRLVLPGKNF